jgi:hypothetical protein
MRMSRILKFTEYETKHINYFPCQWTKVPVHWNALPIESTSKKNLETENSSPTTTVIASTEKKKLSEGEVLTNGTITQSNTTPSLQIKSCVGWCDSIIC